MFSAAVLDLRRRRIAHNNNCYSDVGCVLKFNGIIYDNIKIIYIVNFDRSCILSKHIILHTRYRRARAVFGPAVFYYRTHRDARRGETA